MQPTSPEYKAALTAGAPVAIRGWVQRQEHVQLGPAGLDLSNVAVTFDEFAASRRSLTCDVFDPTGSLRPRFATDAFAPFGNELVIQTGLTLPSGVTEYVQLGVFRMEVTDDSDGRIRVEGLDRSVVIASALNEDPYVIASGTALHTAIGDYLEEKYPGVTFLYDGAAAAQSVPSTLVFEEGTASGNPWQNMRDLALLFARELFFDAYGRAILRPVPTQATGPYAASYTPSTANLAMSAAVRLDPRGVRNVVKVIGEGSGLSESVFATAEVDNPADPLYAGEGTVFGRRPEIIKSAAVSTEIQAQDAAAAILVQRKGVSEDVTITMTPVPAHEPGDVIVFNSTDDVVAGVFALSRWTLDAALRSVMTVATRVLRPEVEENIAYQPAAAEAAVGTGVANNATVSTANLTSATAQAATGTGVANSATGSVKASAQAATGTGVANDASPNTGSGPLFTGGTVTDVGGYRIHTFTSSDTLTMVRAGDVEYLVVAGGGGGGRATTNRSAGGGGAGGMRTGTVTISASQAITVGAGGAGATTDLTAGSDGGASSIGALVTTVGGGGGGSGAGRSGGSGGGQGYTGSSGSGGAGTGGEGNNGGGRSATSGSSATRGGGGGGAGGAGATGVDSDVNPTAGGVGSASSISGSSVTYATGGAAVLGSTVTHGTANRGEGGSGARSTNNGGNGGSGIVIVRYLL